MSLLGPPPPAEAESQDEPAFVRLTGKAQPTLKKLNESWSKPKNRWNVVKLLRLVRLRLEGQPVEFSQLKKCSQTYRAVFQVGRLSAVGAQTGITQVENNPLHLDIDWFGQEPDLPHWWNLDDVTVGKDFERASVAGLLHFLEESFGLSPSGIAPADWSWPEGQSGEDWGNMESWGAPSVEVGFEQLEFEWHLGRNPGAVVPNHAGSTFWWSTPTTSRNVDF